VYEDFIYVLEKSIIAIGFDSYLSSHIH